MEGCKPACDRGFLCQRLLDRHLIVAIFLPLIISIAVREIVPNLNNTSSMYPFVNAGFGSSSQTSSITRFLLSFLSDLTRPSNLLALTLTVGLVHYLLGLIGKRNALIMLLAVIFLGATATIRAPRPLTSKPSQTANSQKPSSQTVNPSALDHWEIFQQSESSDFGDQQSGWSSSSKKRMRESLVLQFQGAMDAQNNPIRVQIEGRDHDRIKFHYSGMNEALATEIFTRLDSNFWNAMRLMSFEEFLSRETVMRDPFRNRTL